MSASGLLRIEDMARKNVRRAQNEFSAVAEARIKKHINRYYVQRFHSQSINFLIFGKIKLRRPVDYSKCYHDPAKQNTY